MFKVENGGDFLMKNWLYDRIVELLYIPALSYFAIRSCLFCASLGYVNTALSVALVWIAALPILGRVSSLKYRLRLPAYVLVWAIIGFSIGMIRIAYYSFPFDSILGILVNSIMAGTLLYRYQNVRCVRAGIEEALSSGAQKAPIETSASLIREMTNSILLANAFAVLTISKSYFEFLISSPKVPSSFGVRALENIAIDSVVIFLLYTGISVLFSMEISRIFRVVVDSASKIMDKISEGKTETKMPDLGSNEIGKLGQALNTLGDRLAEREHIKSLFGKYMSKRVAEKITSTIDGKIIGENKNVAILMSDIRNFTGLCERTEPHLVVESLNRDFEVVVESIDQNDGIIDKFIGDACLAYFDKGITAQPANAALLAAIKIISHPRLQFEHSIGLHFGSVIAGNIGTQKRLEYTIIGDAVNTAARIESQSRVFGRKIVVSQEFKEQLLVEGNQMQFDELGRVKLKGKEKEILLWSPVLALELSVQ
ncbi:MAG: hypothetical protein RLZZ488_2635 [Pseudomonadota bacterium]